MLFGPEKIIACPHCRTLAKVFTLRSGNTSGAVRWTDGKMHAPMLPRAPEITRCPACRRYYWLEEAPEIGRLEVPAPETAPEAWLNAPHVTELNENRLLEALDSGVAVDVGSRVRLRKLAWWAANDAFRAPPRADIIMPGRLSEAAEENLQELYKLLQPEDPESRLMKAEAARQLGRFEECLSLLEHPFPDQFQEAAGQIEALARKGSRQLGILA